MRPSGRCCCESCNGWPRQPSKLAVRRSATGRPAACQPCCTKHGFNALRNALQWAARPPRRPGCGRVSGAAPGPRPAPSRASPATRRLSFPGGLLGRPGFGLVLDTGQPGKRPPGRSEGFWWPPGRHGGTCGPPHPLHARPGASLGGSWGLLGTSLAPSGPPGPASAPWRVLRAFSGHLAVLPLPSVPQSARLHRQDGKGL